MWSTWRKGLLAALILLLCAPLLACGQKDAATARALAELAENSDVPFALGSPLPESADMWEGRGQWAAYQHTPGWGGYRLENEDVCFEMGGWPDVLDLYCVVRLQLTSPRYTLFGLRVGCTPEEADRILTRWGYVPAAEDRWSRGYAKGDVWLGLRWDGSGKITRFMVSIPSTNVEGVVF